MAEKKATTKQPEVKAAKPKKGKLENKNKKRLPRRQKKALMKAAAKKS